jgi:hypothetical protein
LLTPTGLAIQVGLDEADNGEDPGKTSDGINCGIPGNRPEARNAKLGVKLSECEKADDSQK